MKRALCILVVEDHADTAATISQLLRAEGYTVTTAASIGEAERQCANGGYDLIVADLRLPDGFGWELIEKRGPFHGTKAIALSGYATEEDQQRSRAAGFDAHLVKPRDIMNLRETVARVCGEDAPGGRGKRDPDRRKR